MIYRRRIPGLDPSEHNIQTKLIHRLDEMMRPEIVRMAIPNGGLRHPIVGKKLKAEGLLPGSPDLVFALEKAKTLWLEMKTRTGGLSDVQDGVHYKLAELGHTVETAHSVDEAIAILYQHGIIR